MASRRKESAQAKGRNPATTPEGRENQLINSAHDLAEKQILDGSASAQVISHFLKLGSTRERLEQERLANENELLRARVQQIESQAKIEELYMEALGAMRTYQGSDPPELEEHYDER